MPKTKQGVLKSNKFVYATKLQYTIARQLNKYTKLYFYLLDDDGNKVKINL